jgi:prepilin-type N-terminal cleavage/methylation domain-containing protein
MLRRGVKPACSKGFTLAEVLITLAIVGVVAALTIPSLINKCQKIVWAKQAQKEYAMWTQVFKRILADNNTTSLEQTELWSKIHDTCCFDSNSSLEEDFFTEFGKYVKFSIINFDPSALSGYPDYNIVLPNGAKTRYFYFYKKALSKGDTVCKKIKALGGNMCNEIGGLDIDINGDKGPNTYGRDIFVFEFSDDGILHPFGGKDYALFSSQTDLASNSAHWKNIYKGTKEENAKKSQWERTGQLVEEGWKMNW